MNLNLFRDKVFLVTGGTGSFGNTIAQSLLDLNVKEIRIFSRDEKKQEEMRLSLSNKKFKFIIGDVRDYESLRQALIGVNYVFHAAALKQVPSCEFHPLEALKTNVMGSENILRASIENKVTKVVMLSTDKAVYPINTMGLSKALMEKLALAKSRLYDGNETIVCVTRYGNVMGSRGSVIPLFISQLKSNKALTITDPKMTRFLMSLKESVNLVFYAFEHGNQGDIFVQKSPASTIYDLAIVLSQIFTKKINIKNIGTRHGEKLFETLISKEEMPRTEDLGDYYKIKLDDRDLNYDKYFTMGDKNENFRDEYNSHNTHKIEGDNLKSLLLDQDFVKRELDA